MPDGQAALLRLMSWLSPAFPVGAFAYSHGVEQAVHDGLIRDRASLIGWIAELVEAGSAWNDVVMLAAAYRCAVIGDDLFAIAELAEAMSASRERYMETTLQGAAFSKAVAAWESDQTEKETVSFPYPVEVAIATASHSIPLVETLMAFLHAVVLNLIQAAIRIVPLGQRDGVAALAALEQTILQAASRAAESSLDDLGSRTVISDISSMKHEILYSRVFRS